MGKSNRIKSERAQKSVNVAAPKKTQKKEVPSWLYPLITAVVAVFVVVSLVFGTVASSGILMRSSKAVHSDNYKIDGSMLTYMFMSQYQQFVTDYSSYMSYFSLDSTKSLKDQKYGDTSGGAGLETSLLGAFEGSWYDYFMSNVKTQAEQLLVYCEEADARGIVLDETDKISIDAAIAEIEYTATAYGYPTDAYIAQSYGKGVKLKDVRKVMELTTLASKCADEISKDVLDGITDEEIKSKYEGNKRDYDVVDYVYYSLYVDYDEVAADVVDGYNDKTVLTEDQQTAVLTEYQKRIDEAKAKADAFKAYTTVDEFVTELLLDIATDKFDSLYQTEALAEADALTTDALKDVKSLMISKVIDDVKTEKSETADETEEKDGAFLAYGLQITENAAKALDNVKTKLFAELQTQYKTYNVDRLGYDEDDQISKWAFDEAKNVGETKLLTFGDGSKEGEALKKESGYFDASVYMLKKAEYCNEIVSKNVSYMTFATKEAATAAIESFKKSAKLDKAAFDSVAVANSAVTSGQMENYLEGQVSYNGFEDWLYADGTVVGSYTAEPIANAATSATEYAVFFYESDGAEAWFIDVQSSIFAEDYDALYKTLVEKYAPIFNEKTLNKVDA